MSRHDGPFNFDDDRCPHDVFRLDRCFECEPNIGDISKTTDLDTKNGKPFSAASEYLYQKKIEELEAEIESLQASMRSWEIATEIRIGATLLNENQKLREALQEISNSRYTEATAMDLIEIAIGALNE